MFKFYVPIDLIGYWTLESEIIVSWPLQLFISTHGLRKLLPFVEQLVIDTKSIYFLFKPIVNIF